MFCGHLLGHREDEASENKGNLLELLSLRLQESDVISCYSLLKENTFRYLNQYHTLKTLFGINVRKHVEADHHTQHKNCMHLQCYYGWNTRFKKTWRSFSFTMILWQHFHYSWKYFSFYRTNIDGELLYCLLESVLLIFWFESRRFERLVLHCSSCCAWKIFRSCKEQFSSVYPLLYIRVESVPCWHKSCNYRCSKYVWGNCIHLLKFSERGILFLKLFKRIMKMWQVEVGLYNDQVTIRRQNCHLEAVNSVLVISVP